MDSRNFIYMFYGFAVAWLIVFGYVVTLLRRDRLIRDQLERLEAILTEEPAPPRADLRRCLL